MGAPMTVHELKTWPEFWDAIHDGRKTFELRYNDRGFQAGDQLRLFRWNKAHSCYTAPYKPITVTVTYVASGRLFGLHDNWVCLGIRTVDRPALDDDTGVARKGRVA